MLLLYCNGHETDSTLTLPTSPVAGFVEPPRETLESLWASNTFRESMRSSLPGGGQTFQHDGLPYELFVFPLREQTAADSPSKNSQPSLAIVVRSPLQRETARVQTAAHVNEVARRLIHDLAQPLQAIFTFGATLKRLVETEPELLPEKPVRWIGTLFTQSERMVEMIKSKRSRFLPPATAKLSFDPSLAIAISLAENQARLSQAGIAPRLTPLPKGLSLESDPVRLLTAIVLYLDVLIAHFPSEQVQDISFGFAKDPEDETKACLELTFPVPVARKSLPDGYDQKSLDLGSAYHALKRLLGELGNPGTIAVPVPDGAQEDEGEYFPSKLRVSLDLGHGAHMQEV